MALRVTLSSIWLAEYEGVKGVAVVALLIVAYLYWSNLREKRARRRQERLLEQRRRTRDAAGPQN